jgi:ribosomal protein S12 methylthiotransferase accessory factor
LNHLRGCSDKRETWLLDITTDLGIPVVASISADRSDRGFVCGLAARLSTIRAAERAILEMCQMEVGLQIAQWKGDNQPDALTDGDRRYLTRAETIDTASCDLLRHAGTRRAEPQATVHSPTASSLSPIQSAFTAGGVEAVLCDLTRSDIAVPVAWSVAPDLQIFPSTYRTARLAHAIQRYGGAARYTGDVPLF